jgi:hypothetical protein
MNNRKQQLNTKNRNGANTSPDDDILRKIGFSGELLILERRAKELKKIRKTLNELLTCGAYSKDNYKKVNLQLKSKNVPKWEIEIIEKTYDMLRVESHILLKKLSKMIEGYNEMERNKKNE